MEAVAAATAAIALPEGGTEALKEQDSIQDDNQSNTSNKIHTLEDTEDYGPLKKKHKYRDERDKEHHRTSSGGGNTSISPQHNTGLATADEEENTTLTLDSSTEMDSSLLNAPAVVATDADQAGSNDGERDQDHVGGPPPPPSSEAAASTATTTTAAAAKETHAETNTSTSSSSSKGAAAAAGSPASTTEKTRKHNFYVPSRELAALFDNASSTPSTSSGSTLALPLDGTMTSNTNGLVTDSNSITSSSEALLLSSMGTSITGRQAAKIAAMEAKEKLRLAKEAELEEAKNRRKVELERKKLENAKKKAEKEALLKATSNTTTSPTTINNVPSSQSKRKDSLNSQGSVPAKGKRTTSTNASRRSSTKGANKHESPELSIPNNNTTIGNSLPISSSLPTPDIKVNSPSSSISTGNLPTLPTTSNNNNIPVNPGSSSNALASSPPSSATAATGGYSGNVLNLPPMPAPATEGMMGFIPYASEGARAAALAKAAKQKLNNSTYNNNNNNGSPSNIPVGLSTKNGKSTTSSTTGGNAAAGGRKGSNSTGSGGNISQQQQQSGSQQQQQANNKRSKGSNAGNNSNNSLAKSKALQNISNQNNNNNNSSISSISGRASPSNALEHAAAAIDAVLDAGALARAQAQAAEEEEVDDRLYCICQQLYDPERLMIACDRCDNWYHVDCVNIDEASISLIDLFICPICEKDSNQRTVSKPRCAREDCNEPALKLSKYCSDLCGIKVATSKLEASAASPSLLIMNDQNKVNSEELKLLWDAVFEVKKLETVVRSVDDTTALEVEEDEKAKKEAGEFVRNINDNKGDHNSKQAGMNGDKTEDNPSKGVIPKASDLDSRIVEEEYRLEQLQDDLTEFVTKRESLEVSLSLINARLSYLNLAIRRWESSCQAHSLNNTKPTPSSKKSSKSKSGSGGNINADAPCGFDVRLVWDDKDWQEWLDSEEGRNTMITADQNGSDAASLPLLNLPDGGQEENDDDEGLVCKLSRRKCDRHSAWQKLRDADFQVEKASIEKQLEQLTESERRIRRRVEDIQDFLRRAKERLEAENEKKKVQILRSEKDLAEEGVVLQHPNTEEGNDTEDVEMSDSMPPTPAVVLTEA